MKDETKRKTKLEEAIMEVIVFFDIFFFPMTAFEIWNFLSYRCDIREVLDALDAMEDSLLEQSEAYYFLRGKTALVDQRKRRYNYCARKMKRAMWVSRIFSKLPWIKMIAIGNIIGPHNLKDGSDIDFFIVTEKNRLWISRFVTTFLTKLLLLRPKVNDVRDKICLSFYISEDALGLDDMRLGDGDRYFDYWLAGLVPLYDPEKIYDSLIKNNPWIFDKLPNWEPIIVSRHRKIKGSKGNFAREIIDMFFGGLEKNLKSLQLKILPGELRELMNKDTRVLINDSVLKFHVNDKRSEYELLYQKKYNELKY